MQIIIESLPVSSSGHVILVQRLFEKFGYFPEIFADSWIIDFILHGPTIVILLFYFFKTWWNMVFGQNSIDFKIFLKKGAWESLFRPLIFVGIADGITIAFWWSGIAQSFFITQYFLSLGFMITALILYATKWASTKGMDPRVKPEDEEEGVGTAPGKHLVRHSLLATAGSGRASMWNFTNAVILGIAQALSLLPGISRFAFTFGAGRLVCGYQASTSFALSFLIQLPLIGAGFIKGLIAVQKYPELMTKLFAFKSLLVMVVGSLISYGLLCWIGNVIQKNKLYYFAFYMIIPIILSVIL